MGKKKAVRKPKADQDVPVVTPGVEHFVDDDLSIDALDVPSVTPPPAEIAAQEEPSPDEIATDDPPAELIPVDSVVIEVPLRGNYDHPPCHVDCQLDRKLSTTLRRLLDALDHGNYRLAGGRHVATRTDAVRWLFEQIGVQDV